MLNGDASSHPFHSLPPPPPPPPHSHQTLFSSFGYHRLSPSSADEPRYGQGSSPLASCSPWIFLSFPLKRVSFSLCSACPPQGGCRVCVCVHAACACACMRAVGGTRVAHWCHHCLAHPLQRRCVSGAQPSLPTLLSPRSWLGVWAPPKHSQPCARAGLAALGHSSVPQRPCARQSLPAGPSSERVTLSWKGLWHWGLSQGMFLGLAQPS